RDHTTVADASSSTTTINPTKNHHPLKATWIVWYRPPTSKYSDYEKSTVALASVSTVESFWAVYAHLKRPSQLPAISDYHIFRKDIRPVWEDDANKKGGKWIMRLKKGVADRYWEDLLLAIVGDQFGEAGEEICGAVLSVRTGEDVLSVWTRIDGGRNIKIRETIKRLLAFPADTNIQWKSHDDSIAQRAAVDQARHEKQQASGAADRHHHHGSHHHYGSGRASHDHTTSGTDRRNRGQQRDRERERERDRDRAGLDGNDRAERGLLARGQGQESNSSDLVPGVARGSPHMHSGIEIELETFALPWRRPSSSIALTTRALSKSHADCAAWFWLRITPPLGERALPATMVAAAAAAASTAHVSPYPLATALRRLKLGKRIQPVSQALCEDIVERLRPSLARHRHCDLVDIFPGAGLLSTKLHQAVRPRRHILLEPRLRVYGSFLKPLLTTPGTVYSHLAWDPHDVLTYDRLFDEGHLPEQGAAASAGAGAGADAELSDTLLVLANFTASAPVGYSRGFLLMRLLESYLEKTLLNRYGLVRMIGLMPATEGDVVLPKQARTRHRTGLLAECVGKSVAEVASTSTHHEDALARGAQLYEDSRRAALERAARAQVYSPEDRDIPPLELAPKIHRPGEAFPPRAKRDWYDEFEALYVSASNGKIKRPPSPKKRPQTPDAVAQAELYKRYMRMLNRFRNETRNEVFAIETVRKEKELVGEEARILSMLRDPASSVNEIRQAADTLAKQREALLGSKTTTLRFTKFRHEQLAEETAAYYGNGADGLASTGPAASTSPAKPMLLWDQRPYEPMMVSPDEVFPENGQLTVVDFQPNPDSPVLQTRRQLFARDQESPSNANGGGVSADVQYHETVRAFSHLLGVFSMKSSTPVGEIIARLFPGRSMASVLEAIPTLKPYAVRKIFEPVSARERARSVFRKSTGSGKTLSATDALIEAEEAKKDMLSYSDNCLSFTAFRRLPAKVVWDITVEWFAWPGRTPGTEISRLVGGGMSELVAEDAGA
ncbi:hypothetical protein KEM52_006319, partial [Ascosphaera acerosa]